MSTKKWEFNRTGGRSAEVLIYGIIGSDFWGEGLTSTSFIEQLDALGDIEELSVRINSEGGLAFEGAAIYNALARHPAVVTVHIDGLAASAASQVAMAADPGKLLIADNARMMIHNAWNIEMGDKWAMRKMATRLEALDELIVDAYMKRAKVDRKEIQRMMDEEAWLNASEAAKVGLADEVEDQSQAAALWRSDYDLSRFKHPPKELTNVGPKGRLAAAQRARDDADAIAIRMRLLDLEQKSFGGQ